MATFEDKHPRIGDGSFTNKEQSKPELSIGGNRFTDMAPPAIDAELAQHSYDAWRIDDRINSDRATIQKLADEEAEFERSGIRRNRWATPPEIQIEEANKRIATNVILRAEIQEKIDPIDEEFERRGGWTRFFVTSGSNAHVHSSRSCTTCYPTTRFGWLTDHSGMDETEIVELAGDEACTVCFPTAPVADRNAPRQNRLETPDAKAARILREEEKRAREAKKAASAITAPNGDPVYDDYGYPFKTERAAELAAIDGLSSRVWYDDHPYAPKWNRVAADAEDAIANKRGITVSELREIWKKKLAQKAKRDGADERWADRGETIFHAVDEFKAQRSALQARWDKLAAIPNKSVEELSRLSSIATEIESLSSERRSGR